jgi:hypothetical protein
MAQQKSKNISLYAKGDLRIEQKGDMDDDDDDDTDTLTSIFSIVNLLETGSLHFRWDSLTRK